MQFRKTAISSWFDSTAKPIIRILLIPSLIALAVVAATVKSIKANGQIHELKDQLNATAAGRFALVQLRECQTGGSEFSERSEIECVGPVIEAAKMLRGDVFSHEVSQSLAIWVDRRTSRD